MDTKKHVLPPEIIAEIGCNHKGEVAIAKEMIHIAKVFCNADYVKFQKRNPKELLSEEQYNSPHPVAYHSYGETYGEHRNFLEFDIETHSELKACCEAIGIRYACSVWDTSSLKQIMTLDPDYIKVPSAMNTNWEMLGYLCDHYAGDIHVALGMTTRTEEENVIAFFESKGRLNDVVLYHCTSGYPVPPRDICLMEIKRLYEKYKGRVKDIGFSAHYTGIGLDGPAFLLGAKYIERHFTLDRAWKGTDHAASLEPDGLRRVRKDTQIVADAMRYKQQDILEIEKPQREKLKFRTA